MSYFQKHLRHYNQELRQNKQHLEQRQPEPRTSEQQPLRNKKMNCQRIKTQHSSQHSKRFPHREENCQPQVQPRKAKRPSVRFATEGPASGELSQGPMKSIFQDADHSMEEMLNSSFRQFEQVLLKRDLSNENTELAEENRQLKGAVQELMNILRGKLEEALQKQEQELKGVMSDYIQLITKLLADKQQLSLDLEEVEKQLDKSRQQVKVLQEKQPMLREKEGRDEASERQYALLDKIGKQDQKISTLYHLLQRSEDQRKYFEQTKSSADDSGHKFRELESQFESRLEEKEREFEEIFQEYDKVMKEALRHKDAAISRLTRITEARGGQGCHKQGELFNQSNYI